MRRIVATLVALGALAAPAALAREPEPISVGHREQVFSVERSGGVERLTRGASAHYGPTWSNDGRTVAVESTNEIALVRIHHGRRARPPAIEGGPALTGPVAWAPDDRRIAFVAYHCRSGPGCWIVGNLVVADRDGRHRHVIARDAESSPQWSSDGSTIYYLTHHQDEDGASVYAVSPRGTHRRHLVSRVPRPARVLLSPDGSWLLFVRREPKPALWLASTGDRGKRKLAGIDAYTTHFGWTDGGRAVFGGRSGRHPVVTPLSGRRRVLGATTDSDVYDVSPDGHFLAWAGPPVNDLEIRVSRTDGGDKRVVARFTSRTTVLDDLVRWSPDSRRLVTVPYRYDYY